jgi:hypothetical protein
MLGTLGSCEREVHARIRLLSWKKMRVMPTFPPKYIFADAPLPRAIAAAGDARSIADPPSQRFPTATREGTSMSKRIWSSLVLTIALAAPGCRMCCPSYDYCGPLDPAESNAESCGMSRRGSAFNGYIDGEVVVPEEMEHAPAPAAPQSPVPPEPVKKQAMIRQASKSQAQPIPVPHRESPANTSATQSAPPTSSRRAS